MGADTKGGGAAERTLRAAAHSRLVIIVSLRTAASAEAPWTPMPSPQRLQGMSGGSERAGACQWALTQRGTLWGGGAPEVGDHRLVEDGSERNGALVSDVVASETASEGQGGSR